MDIIEQLFSNVPEFALRENRDFIDDMFEGIPEFNITRLPNIDYDRIIDEAINEYDYDDGIYQITKELLRSRRYINSNMHYINQEPVIDDIVNTKLIDVINDPYARFFDQHFKSFIKEPLIILHDAPTIKSFSIAMQYFTYPDGDENLNKTVAQVSNGFMPYTQFITYKKGFSNNINYFYDNLIFHFNGEGSGYHPFVVGYRIVFEYTDIDSGMDGNTLYELKAFKPTSDRKFHRLCVASTNINTSICIYESFLYINDPDGFNNYKNEKQLEETKRKLKDEGKEIEEAVKDGKLILSLELLTKKYDNEIIVVFYGTNFCYNEEDNAMTIRAGYYPIRVNKGKAKQIKYYEDIYELDNKLVMLYDKKGMHVAPSIFKMDTKKNVQNIIKKKSFFLKPTTIKNNKVKFNNVLAFDFETYKDEHNNAIPFCVCVYGRLKGKEVKKKFYGLGCEDELVDYFYSIRTQTNRSKSNSKKSIDNIYIYGFNNAAFDNIFIYQKLYKVDPSTRYVISGSTIKYISIDNIKIMDIRLQYAGSLKSVARAFKLDIEKDIYPYTFPNSNNLNYVGEVPEHKYWKKPKYYDICKERTGGVFDLKKYTTKYCLLDCELTYEIAIKHLGECTGKCNNKNFNVADCPTSAGLSLKMFNQCFQSDYLSQSDEKIVAKEKLAYKGGRTEVFKKKFKAEGKERLFYYDINSSYPSSMTEEMPFKYHRTETYATDPRVIKPEGILVPYNLYLAKVVYNGDNKEFIPNILVRDEKSNEIIAVKETDFTYQWGCELIEAFNNGCEVYLRECVMYKPKKVFDKFANHFYNERLKVKSTNVAKAMFYKTVMNSLYGKFGQRVFNKVGMASNCTEMYRQIEGDNKILLNIITAKDLIIYEYKERNAEFESVGKLMRFASYITALSRCKLSKLMRDVGHENVYYCDTDSVFTSVKPSDDFIDQTVLGKWKMECNPIHKAIFLAPKLYTYETEDGEKCKKAKGITAKKVNFDDYEKLVDGSIDSISQMNHMFFRSLNNVRIEAQERTIGVVYNKRNWSDNKSEAFQNIEEWIANKI